MVEKSFGRAQIFRALACPVGIIAGEQPTHDSNHGRLFAHRLAGLGMRTGMTSVAILVADAAADRAAGNRQLLIWGSILVAVLVLGAIVLARLDRWRKRMTGPEEIEDTLSAFRLSYEEGEISEEEYKRIRAKLAGAKPAPPIDKSPDAPTS